MLSNASHLAHLPSQSLDALTREYAKYLVGWSHGKETLRPGVVDTHKGSYYINCAFVQDAALQSAPTTATDAKGSTIEYSDFSEFTTPNVWPKESELPTFQSSVTDLCSLIVSVAGLVARACDRFAVESIPDYKPGYLEHVVTTSLTTKARLLHYFPQESQDEVENTDEKADDDWCATHLDHGCLTGLTSAMFIDEAQNPPAGSDATRTWSELPKSPDPAAGLYIRSRTGSVVKVNIPKDCLAFQTGESLQLITKGKLRAVPHFVKGARASASNGHSLIARNTLAVFTQPNLAEEVQPGITFADFARGVVAKNTA